jgi:hypothetical protein
MDMAFLGDLLTSVADRGRALIGFERFAGRNRPIAQLCEDLLSGRGEASGMAAGLFCDAAGEVRARPRPARQGH